MRYSIFRYMTVILIAVTLSAYAENTTERATDGFEYASESKMAERWTILQSGFTKPAIIKLKSGNVKEGKKALELRLPLSKPTGGSRIDLDIFPDIALENVKQIIFWLYIDNPQYIAQTGIHCGDSDWSNHYSKFGIANYEKGWQRVIVSTDAMVVGGGNPTWESANKMRITFWFNPGSKPIKVMIDDVVWTTRKERDMILNQKWYD